MAVLAPQDNSDSRSHSGIPECVGKLWVRPNSTDGNWGTIGALQSEGGAFRYLFKENNTTVTTVTSSVQQQADVVTFDASRSNAMYGASTSIRVPSYQLLMIIKA